MTEEEFIRETAPNRFHSDWVYLFWFKPIRKFLIQNLNKCWGSIKMIDIIAGAKIKGKPSKKDMIFICSKIYTNPDILTDFYQTLSKEEQLLIEKATWYPSLDAKQLNEIYGREVIKVKKNQERSYDPYTLAMDPALDSWQPFMEYRSYVWDAEDARSYLEDVKFKLSFPPLLRKAYGEILSKPEGYNLLPINKPENTSVFNAEETVFHELPLILAYYYQGNLRYTTKGYPNLASAKKMGRSLRLNQFPSEEETGLRGILISGLFSDNFNLTSLSEKPLKIFRQLFTTDFNIQPAIPYLLPHLKGINKLHYSEVKGAVTNDIFNIFHELPPGKWISFENLQTYISTHFINIQAISYYDLDKLVPAEALLNIRTHYHVVRDDMPEFVNIPLLAGHIYLLAAFGLMEIAVDETIPFNYSYYDGLKAFKLTNLGAYLFGLKMTYTPPKMDNETRLLFDANAPIIRIEGNKDLGSTMLDKYAVKVSQNRFQFNPGKFLKDCNTTDDLIRKVAFFKQTIGKKLPVFWEDYIEQLVDNSKVIKKKNDIITFQLPSNDKQLHRLIAQDPVLRPVIIKAEKYYVLLEKKKWNTFVNRMKELGYLVE